jgi:RHS repeat-associated protein
MNWNGSPLIQSITWNALNQPTGWTWAFTTPVNATRSYDTAGRTTATEITSYSYDAAGRITSLTQNLGQPADSDPNSTSVTFANTTFTVGYDATGRITSFGDGTTTTSFTYDANGNRQSSTTTAGATTTSRTYTVEATSNRLTGFTQDITGPGGNSSTAVSYTYNANGDITADGLRNFSFDAEGRLSSVATGSTQTSPTTRYAHSALGERLFKTEPLQIGQEPEPGQEQNFIEQLFTFFKMLWAPQTTTAEQLGWAYAYDEEGTLLSEIGMGGASSTGQTSYIWLPTPNGPMPVAAIVNGNTYAVHADHLNTPRRLTNQYGEAAWQWKFSAFGDENPTRAAKRFVDPEKTPGMGSGTVADVTYNLRYPGQTADQESGLYYNYFRWYNSSIGRYTQVDPIGLRGGWNVFAYAENIPLVLFDPLGLAPPSKKYSYSTRGVHHPMNNATARDMGWSPAATKAFDENPFNVPLHGRHDRVAGMSHMEYNKLVREYCEKWTRDNKVNPKTATAEDAQRFIQDLRYRAPDKIMQFNRELWMRHMLSNTWWFRPTE